MNGTLLGYTAIVLLSAVGARWLLLMWTVRIPRNRWVYITASVIALLLGSGALSVGASAGATAAAIVSTAGAALFLLLCSASRQAQVTPAVRVGQPILDFEAIDDAGRPFSLEAFRGRRFLLKFFRGHWCPYCVAELRRWNELAPELAGRGVEVVTICSDTPEQIRSGRRKHGLVATMLSDPSLAITDLYNLRNPKSFAPKPGLVIPLPIPTTILVDETGIVRWIDQCDDYMRRSDPGIVLGAVCEAFGGPPPSPRPTDGDVALPAARCLTA